MKRFFRFLAPLLLVLAAACSSAPEAVSVPLLSDAQKSYQKMPRKERVAYFADAEKRKEMSQAGYYPLEARIALPFPRGTFSFEETPDTVLSAKRIELGKIAVEVPPYVRVQEENGMLLLGNLKIATRYDWVMRDGKRTAAGAIRTEDMPPRLLKIDGVPNVRDLGGRIGLGGRRVKQGLVYRTAGLNDNAAKKELPEDVLRKRDPKLDQAVALHEKTIRELESQLKAGVREDAGTLPYTLDNVWTVFRTAKGAITESELAKIASWKEIPAEYLGVKGETVRTDEKGIFLFPGKEPYRPAVFVKTFESPVEGILRIGCGADWFLRVYVNGEMVYDIWEAGNPDWPLDVSNHQIDLKVRKGKNIIVCPMMSGSNSFAFCFGKNTEAHRKITAEKKAAAKLLSDAQTEYIPGKNRLSPEMKSYLVNDLRIRSDIDLRTDWECFEMTGSPAGDKVTWFHYSSECYAGMAGEAGKEAFKKVFRVFLDENNYPIVFHCIAGQDRTGAVAFILNGLLGVSEEQLYLDWESTGYWNKSTSFTHEKRFDKLYHVFDAYPGKTIQERIEAYVLSLGFTDADLEHFRKIMLEE